MQLIIMAGGLATRLRPLTTTIPKSMISICGRPFLEYQVELAISRGISEIVLCVGYLSEQIERYFGDGAKFGIKITYSKEGDRLLGTGGALKKAEGYLDHEFLLLYGDSYLPISFDPVIRKFHSQPMQALMTVFKNENRFDNSNVKITGDLVSHYDKNSNDPSVQYIDYGLSMMKKDVLKNISAGQVYPLENLYKMLVANGQMHAYEVHQPFYEIGSAEGIESFERYIDNGKGCVL